LAACQRDGTRITFDHTVVTIVGVTPPGFLGVEVGRTFDMILPIKADLQVLPANRFDDDVAWLNILLRLQPGISLESSTAALRAVQPQIRAGSLPKQFASTYLQEPFVLEPVGAGTSTLRERFERPLVAILVVVALVLLIACANIANRCFCARRRAVTSWSVCLPPARRGGARPSGVMESVVLALVGTTLGVVPRLGPRVIGQLEHVDDAGRPDPRSIGAFWRSRPRPW
jgi:hypothetical protein